MLNRLAYSEGTSTQMEHLIERLPQVTGSQADHAIEKELCGLFDAISDPRSLRKLLTREAAQIERAIVALKMCLTYSSDLQVTQLLSEGAVEENLLQNKANGFIKEFSETILMQYCLLNQEIEEIQHEIRNFDKDSSNADDLE